MQCAERSGGDSTMFIVYKRLAVIEVFNKADLKVKKMCLSFLTAWHILKQYGVRPVRACIFDLKQL